MVKWGFWMFGENPSRYKRQEKGICSIQLPCSVVTTSCSIKSALLSITLNILSVESQSTLKWSQKERISGLRTISAWLSTVVKLEVCRLRSILAQSAVKSTLESRTSRYFRRTKSSLPWVCLERNRDFTVVWPLKFKNWPSNIYFIIDLKIHISWLAEGLRFAGK